MRRSFMSDELYWVIFQEYVQNQLQKGDKPLEFFLEGTRSRTGKFLHPKLGTFLSCFWCTVLVPTEGWNDKINGTKSWKEYRFYSFNTELVEQMLFLGAT